MPCAPVCKVVSIYAREHHVSQTPALQSLGGVFRLVRIQREGLFTRLDTAESAPSRASIAHQHDRSRCRALAAPAPAIADVGTSCFLADSVQIEAPEIVLDPLVIVIAGYGRLQPIGQSGMRPLAPLWPNLHRPKLKSLVLRERRLFK